jgi:hypothetical protein
MWMQNITYRIFLKKHNVGCELDPGIKRTVFWVVAPCGEKFTEVSEVFAASVITVTMEAARNPETLLNFHQTTRRYNPQNNHLHTRRSA